MWAIKQSSSTSYNLSFVTSRSNHAHSHTARITRVTRPQCVGFMLVLSFYKVVNPWTFLSFAYELCQTQTSSKISKTSPDITMYAKLLLRRNNMKRPSEMRRSFILRPSPWCQRRPSNRADHFLELFGTPAGTLKTFVVFLFASIFVKKARLLLVIQDFWRRQKQTV